MPQMTKRDLITDNCNKQCSYWVEKMTPAAADQLEVWIRDGHQLGNIVERMKGVFDFDCTERTLYRHVQKHMHAPSEEQQEEAMTDLQVLERMIRVGAKNLRSDTKIRITPEMTVRAIELKYKLTQGNVFESFLDQIGKVMDEEIPRVEDPGVQSEDEASQALEE